MPNYWIATYDGPTSSGTGSDLGRDIAVDTSGNCYVTGRSSNGSNDDIFLMKYSTSGILQWQRKLQGSSTSEESYGVAVDSSGNCYITAFTFASGVSNDIVVAKYNTSGALLWQRFLGSSNTEIGYGIAVDSSGNCYVTGYGTLAAKDGIVTAKFNTSGTLQWQRRLESGSADCYGTGIAVDSSGDCYVIGQSVVTGVADIIVAKYNTSGTLQWQRQLASGGNDRGSRIAVDSSGNCYITGYAFFSGASNDIVTAKYNTSGTLQWQRRLSGSLDDEAYGIAVDSSGNCYVTGWSANLSVTNDMLVVKYNTSGTLQWQRRFGSSGSDIGRGIAVDASGNCYVTGNSDVLGSSDVIVFKVPGDGSGAGTYGPFTYAASSLTDSAGTLTDSAGALTGSSASLTDTTGTLTNYNLYDIYGAP